MERFTNESSYGKIGRDEAAIGYTERNRYSMCNKIKKRGKMYLYEQEQLRELLDVYTSLGGNGTAHAIVEKVLLEYDVVSDDEEMD